MSRGALPALAVPAHLLDHRVDGRPVLPAVEALQLLAERVGAVDPLVPVTEMGEARFLRFLPLGAGSGDGAALDALAAEVSVDATGLAHATLLTEHGRDGAARRTKVHVTARFGGSPAPVRPPWDRLAAVPGVLVRLDPEILYAALVPFGPAFRNVVSPVLCGPDGALAEVRAPELPGVAPSSPLGASLVLDAALHVACAWGQVSRRRVSFPTGFRERVVRHPASPGRTYTCRVFPTGAAGGADTYDVWLLDEHGAACDVVSGLVMEELFSRRVRPPDGLATFDAELGGRLSGLASGVALVDLEAVAPWASRFVGAADRARLETMSGPRSRAFLAGRAALSTAARRFAAATMSEPSTIAIEASSDRVPRCSWPGQPAPCFASLSHDRRFALAVVDERPVGVDIEAAADKAERHRAVYLDAAERAVLDASPCPVPGAALRAWTFKEALAKALSLPLPTAWSAARIQALGTERSIAVHAGCSWVAHHVEVDGHVATVARLLEGGGG